MPARKWVALPHRRVTAHIGGMVDEIRERRRRELEEEAQAEMGFGPSLEEIRFWNNWLRAQGMTRKPRTNYWLGAVGWVAFVGFAVASWCIVGWTIARIVGYCLG